MPYELFGHKTVAFFDLWSFIHFFSGVVIASFLFNEIKRLWPSNIKESITLFGIRFNNWIDILVILCAFSWELLELGLEKGLLGAAVAAWFDGTEFWGNRFLADPLLVYLGYIVGKHYFHREGGGVGRFLKYASRCSIAAWLALHTMLPHSMYIQKLITH